MEDWCSVEELARWGFTHAPVVMVNKAYNGLATCIRTRDVGIRMIHTAHEVSLRFSDGRTVSTGRPPGGAEPAGPFLRMHGGGGSSHFNQMRWWAWPLPPGGPLEFICQWPAMGISETRVSIEAELILDAARRAVLVWPEHQV